MEYIMHLNLCRLKKKLVNVILQHAAHNNVMHKKECIRQDFIGEYN